MGFLLSLLLICPTTLDGLPMCPHIKMSAQKCLSVYTPDKVGGFCEWYGYATIQQADAFEKRRGFYRYYDFHGSGDMWTKDCAKTERESLGQRYPGFGNGPRYSCKPFRA